MTEWLKKQISVGNLIELLILVATIIWLVAFLRADINNNTRWNARQDESIQEYQDRVRSTYVRKDVAQQRYQNLMDKLEEMNEKLDH